MINARACTAAASSKQHRIISVRCTHSRTFCWPTAFLHTCCLHTHTLRARLHFAALRLSLRLRVCWRTSNVARVFADLRAFTTHVYAAHARHAPHGLYAHLAPRRGCRAPRIIAAHARSDLAFTRTCGLKQAQQARAALRKRVAFCLRTVYRPCGARALPGRILPRASNTASWIHLAVGAHSCARFADDRHCCHERAAHHRFAQVRATRAAYRESSSCASFAQRASLLRRAPAYLVARTLISFYFRCRTTFYIKRAMR